MSTTTRTLASAWRERWADAATALQQTERAPGLFEPAYVETLRDEAKRARKQYKFWARLR